jgi:hypothetical protein
MFLSHKTRKISIFLSTLPFLVLFFSLGSDIQVVFGYENEDIEFSYLNDERALIVFYSILDIFEVNPFEHQIEIEANQIFPNESLKNEVMDF